MSRCFPFPPPGYVRKAGVESSANVDLLKQDNHKEKKDKKEKDRKKREGKERKEKHRSDDKHRDKKEKKDKHRDRKDKNKGKEKDHTSSLSDKKLSFQAGGTNEETTPKVKGFLPSLLASGLSIDRSVQKEKERDKHRTIAPYGNKPAGQSAEKIPTYTNLSRDTCDNNKFVQELEERIKHDRISGTHLAERFIVAEKKKDDPLVQFLEKPNSNMRPEVEESNKERRDNESMVERVNGTCKVHDVVRIFHTRVKDEINLVEQNIQREIHWREKVKGMDGEDNWADEIKGKDDERKDQGKDDQRKDQGKVELDREDKERMGEKIEPSRHSEQEKLKISRKNDSLRSSNRKNLQLPVKGPDLIVGSSGSDTKKRKETKANGFLHANEIRASKIPKQSLVSHSPMENGRTLESCRRTSPLAPPWTEPTNNGNNILMDRKINGIMECWGMPPVSPVKVQSSASVTDDVPVVKLPHPECKLLDEILSRVPRLEELPEFYGDQGWLFDTDEREDSKKSIVDAMPQVWGESLHVESVDIYALPYVIPY